MAFLLLRGISLTWIDTDMKRNRSTMLITSRGCPHQCAYCSAHLVMGNSFRTRSPEAILEEMKDCRERYGIRVFDIEDDNFTFDQERAKRLLNLIIETFGEGSLELSAMNGVSFASLDKELLEIMKKAGFRHHKPLFCQHRHSHEGEDEKTEGADRV